MLQPLLSTLRAQWQAIVGWLVFLALLIALFLDHYVFDPFIFGFAYYAIYVLTRFGKKEERSDQNLTGLRMLLLCVICLLYLWVALQHEVDRRSFLSRFERTCYRSPKFDSELGHHLCEEVQADIDATLQKEVESSDE
jgi:hypothetical protein